MSAPLSTGEMQERRNLNREFILSNPQYIVLSRPSLVDDGAGGVKPGTVAALPGQLLRLVALNRDVPMRTTVDGREVQPSYRLLGLYNANIVAGDYWMAGSVKYEVVWVEPDRLDALRAEVVYGR